MSEIQELQAEEKEALLSIYEGDNNFHVIDDKKYQYMYGEKDDPKSFLIEIVWSENYPNEFSESNVNMDTFYNRNISSNFKSKIVALLIEEAQMWLGCSMTFTLFECLKEKLTELLEQLSEELANVPEVTENVKSLQLEPEVIKCGDAPAKVEKKEQLTKAQKRRQWQQTDHKGNKARGWDWVDIVKHLSQTGYKEELAASSASTPTVSTN